MARKQRHPEHENHERWLVSYADFITLLFAFFVVMFASSQEDKGKAQQMSESVRAALEQSAFTGAAPGRDKAQAPVEQPPPKPAPNPINPLLAAQDVLTAELAGEIKSGHIRISMEARGLVVSFADAALFPSGEDVISTDAHSGLEKVAAAIGRLNNPVRLEGHTDSRPIKTSRFKSNWDLSASRSIALLKILTERFDVAASRLSVAGYADTAPIASNDTDEGRARNRRVDIIVLNDRGVMGEPLKPRQAEPEQAKAPGIDPPHTVPSKK
ncbi:MAG: flagellar motor protein MotB [Acidobacteriota bacterium]